MLARGNWLGFVVLGALVLLPACGGGGGPAAGNQIGWSIAAVEVLTQPMNQFSPFGSTAGGDEVRIVGIGFEPAMTVYFGSTPAALTNVASPTEIRAFPSAMPPGTVDVSVRNSLGDAATLQDAITFYVPPAVASLVSIDGPTAGETRAPIAGGNTLEITGSNFVGTETSRIDGLFAPSIVQSPTIMHVTVPPRPGPGAVNVDVISEQGIVTTMLGALTYTQEFSLDPATDALSLQLAQHLYSRAAFGASPAVLQQAVNDGLGVTVGNLLTFVADPVVEQAALDLYDPNFPPSGSISTRTNRRWWVYLILNNPNPLQEKLAWFFHDHFATSQSGMSGRSIWFLWEQIELLRANSLGSWRDLLSEVARNQAMLVWLDGIVSTGSNPNENWAREFWELFTLGVDDGSGARYTQGEIVEASRAFTGYRRRTAPGEEYHEIIYELGRHDAGSKTIFGQAGMWGYDDNPDETRDTGNGTYPSGGMVDLTLGERPIYASEFICKKLLEYFVYENPHPQIVGDLALVLRSNNWELEPVMRTLLQSKALFSGRALAGQVKDPVSFVFSFLRTTEIDLSINRVDANHLAPLEQIPMQPPDVNGWVSGTAWLGSQAMLLRINFLQDAIDELETVADIQALLPPVGQRTPANMVDNIATLLGVQLSGSARTSLITYVTSELQGDTIVNVGFDPTDDDELLKKTRGLLWMTAQYWEGHQQ